ncbi:MAG: CCA tRNA nucleotidyltransferase, partial [Candidatus Subteraquimicrobiales bacterium]|nr:CCA tRNA nucleotidyltransferase [Candidatus Subteraquimicrobiales bacterium]
MVGGSVRDELLGKLHEDFDFATDATPDEIVKITKAWADNLWLIGAKFGTVNLTKDGFKIEITTFRQEIYPEDTRHPKVSFALRIESDLSRRDFTINAMAVKLPESTLIDPFGGKDDLRLKILKTPLSAVQSFLDDPLRMLRAIRFVASLNLEVSLEIKKAISKYHSALKIVSKERIRDELSRILISPKPSEALRLVVETNLTEEVVPELTTLKVT